MTRRLAFLISICSFLGTIHAQAQYGLSGTDKPRSQMTQAEYARARARFVQKARAAAKQRATELAAKRKQAEQAAALKIGTPSPASFAAKQKETKEELDKLTSVPDEKADEEAGADVQLDGDENRFTTASDLLTSYPSSQAERSAAGDIRPQTRGFGQKENTNKALQEHVEELRKRVAALESVLTEAAQQMAQAEEHAPPQYATENPFLSKRSQAGGTGIAVGDAPATTLRSIPSDRVTSRGSNLQPAQDIAAPPPQSPVAQQPVGLPAFDVEDTDSQRVSDKPVPATFLKDMPERASTEAKQQPAPLQEKEASSDGMESVRRAAAQQRAFALAARASTQGQRTAPAPVTNISVNLRETNNNGVQLSLDDHEQDLTPLSITINRGGTITNDQAEQFINSLKERDNASQLSLHDALINKLRTQTIMPSMQAWQALASLYAKTEDQDAYSSIRTLLTGDTSDTDTKSPLQPPTSLRPATDTTTGTAKKVRIDKSSGTLYLFIDENGRWERLPVIPVANTPAQQAEQGKQFLERLETESNATIEALGKQAFEALSSLDEEAKLQQLAPFLKLQAALKREKQPHAQLDLFLEHAFPNERS